MSSPPRRTTPEGALRRVLIVLGLGLVTFWIYRPVGNHTFLNFDDDEYVTANAAVLEGWSAEGARWAFSQSHAANYHPLTWLSHMLDVELFELDAGAHHLTSAVLHALNAALAACALWALTRSFWPSVLVAALFAWHPLRVESVAWVSERKDLLVGFFWFATLWAYARYARAPSIARYLPVALGVGCALLSKPMAVTLPFVLLLVDLWPLKRTQALRRLVSEKLPLFALALAFIVVTWNVQRAAGAMDSLEAVGLQARLANAGEATVDYVRTTLWPKDLACFYPHPALVDESERLWTIGRVASALAVAGISLFALGLWRRAPSLFVGWFWFLGTLVPVIGIVQVGSQARADRYTYLPLVGFVMLVVFGLDRLLAKTKRTWAAVALGCGGLAAAACVPLTMRQVRVWRDDVTLFEHALAVTERNYLAHTNLGEALEERGQLSEAATHYARALEIMPASPPILLNLGKLRALSGESKQAEELFRRALDADSSFAAAHGNLGALLSGLGRDREALEHLERALRPDATGLRDADALSITNTLAWVLATSRDANLRDGARALELARACAEKSGYAQAGILETLAAAHAESGDFEEAIRVQRAALERVPTAYRSALEERLSSFAKRQPFRKNP